MICELLSPQVVAGTPAPDDDYWYTDLATVSRSGANVTPDSAMQVSAVMACVRVLAESMASLPLIVYRRLEPRGKERATEHPLYTILHDAPNRSTAELLPLHPDRVKVERLPNGKLLYTVTNPVTGQSRILDRSAVFHVRGLSSDGLWGLSPIALARESIGLALATEAHGSRLFSNKAIPGGILTTPNKLSDIAHRHVKEELLASYSQANAHKTLVLEEDLKWEQLGLTNEDSQFLQTRRYQTEEIARIYRMQLHMIGDLTHATYSNVTHLGIEFVMHTLRPWNVRWEQAIQRDLIGSDEYFAEFLVDALLRGDQDSRYKAYNTGIQAGFLTRNEVREFENLNPLEGLDEPLEPMNMQRAGAGEEPEGAEPVPPNSEPPPDEAASPVTPVADLVGIMVEDIAERLANAEIRELGKHVPKAMGDRERFNTWVVHFYAGHRAYACRTLAPLLRAWDATHDDEPPVETILEVVIDHPCEVWKTTESPEAVLAVWRDNRMAELTGDITRSLGYERN
jgi:HK97 family phage portal protein